MAITDGDRQMLADRAREIEEWAETCFIDDNGVVYTAIDRATERPLCGNGAGSMAGEGRSGPHRRQ